jgi:hypothetical protein
MRRRARAITTHRISIRGSDVTSRLRKRLVVLAVVGLVALTAATAAFAWSSMYVGAGGPETFIPGDDDRSGFAGSLQGNVVDWDAPWGGNPNMGSRYVNSQGDGLNAFDWRAASFIDFRNVSYGAAQCRASNGNNFSARVWQCYTEN